MSGSLPSQYPVELGCLYVINQSKSVPLYILYTLPLTQISHIPSPSLSHTHTAAEHVVRYVKEKHNFYKEFQDKVVSDEEVKVYKQHYVKLSLSTNRLESH